MRVPVFQKGLLLEIKITGSESSSGLTRRSEFMISSSSGSRA